MADCHRLLHQTINLRTFADENKGTRYPRSVIYFKTAESEGKTIHVNQKPIALLEYLIKTYTKEGDTVLDFASGSMSTAIACIYTNRKCICIEKDETYFSQGEKRVDRKSTRLNSSHIPLSRMPSSA